MKKFYLLPIIFFTFSNTISAKEIKLPDYDQAQKQIMANCKSTMGQFGGGYSLIKTCVDTNLEDFKIVKEYIKKHTKITKNCMQNQFMRNNYSLIKVCVEQEVEAKKALENY